MNYAKLYYNFINLCQNSKIKDRLNNRNKNDSRIFDIEIYTEIHHIIPRSSGGSDNLDNLVTLLPEEHLFAHKLLYKAYKHRNDMLAVRFCLNGYANKKHIKCNLRLTKSILNGYSWIKQHSSSFRKNVGWHTKEGIENISNSRKNTMPCKEVDTGKSIGSLPIDHPKILSGEYVHITKNRKFTPKQLEDHSIKNSKEKNGNYSGLTDKEIIHYAYKMVLEAGLIWNNTLWRKYIKKYNIPKSFRPFRFDGNGLMGLRFKVVEKLNYENLIFDEHKILYPYRIKSNEHKENLKNSILGRKRYHSNNKNYYLFPNDIKIKELNLNKGFKNVKN